MCIYQLDDPYGEEATRRLTDDVALWDEECYDWFEQSGIVAFTWLGPKK